MDHSLVMNVDQSLGHAFQLDDFLIVSEEGIESGKTYERDPIYPWMCLDKVANISILHPVRYHSEMVLGYHHSDQWQNVPMPQGFPHYHLLAEFLHKTLSVHHTRREGRKKLAPIILCKSLSEYVLITLTATSRPRCSPFHTSANPPLYDTPPTLPNDTLIYMTRGRSA